MRQLSALKAIVGILAFATLLAVGQVHPQVSAADELCSPETLASSNGQCEIFTWTPAKPKPDDRALPFIGTEVLRPTPPGGPEVTWTPVPEVTHYPALPALPAVTSTVTGDVDIYDAPGGVGTVIGMLGAGTQVTKNCQADNWCEVPGHGWVWGDFLS